LSHRLISCRIFRLESWRPLPALQPGDGSKFPLGVNLGNRSRRGRRASVHSVVGLRTRVFKLLGYRNRLRERMSPQLLHHCLAVSFDGTLRCAEFMRDLLIELASNDESKNRALPRRERVHEGTQRAKPRYVSACFRIASRPAEWYLAAPFWGRLRQKILRASLNGSDTHRNISVPGQEDNRQYISFGSSSNK